MKKTLPKFLVAQNELAKSSQPFIVHTQRPAFIARALSFADDAAAELYIEENHPTYAVLLEQMPVLLEIVECWGAPADLKPGLLQRMSHWYYQTQIKPGIVASTTTPPPAAPASPSESAT